MSPTRATLPKWMPGFAMAAVLVASGCAADSDPVGPRDIPLSPTPFVVSNPGSAAASARPAGGLAASVGGMGGTAYVSLPSATIANASQATVRNLATGASVATPMVLGGFDPVPVVATPGDTLEVEIERTTGLEPLRYRMLVPEHSPPVVVRTVPRAGKRDVPLNAVIVIVFSEPIDPITLTSETLALRKGTVTVGGTIRFADDAHLTVELVPGTTLDPETNYEVLITEGIQDLDGEPMAQALTTAFTTGVRPGALATRIPAGREPLPCQL